MRKLSNKQKLEMLIGKVVLLIIESLIGCGLVLGFFWVIGLISNFMETHFWAFAIMGIIDLVLIFKMINE